MQFAGLTAELVSRGEGLFKAKQRYGRFTGLGSADRLINSIRMYPHAFVIGCLMDKQLKAERAWQIPYEIRRRVGSFEFDVLAGLPEKKWVRLMARPTPLHRFPEKTGREAYLAVLHIAGRYEGDAARIWNDNPSSATVICRFLPFIGIGPKAESPGLLDFPVWEIGRE